MLSCADSDVAWKLPVDKSATKQQIARRQFGAQRQQGSLHRLPTAVRMPRGTPRGQGTRKRFGTTLHSPKPGTQVLLGLPSASSTGEDREAANISKISARGLTMPFMPREAVR